MPSQGSTHTIIIPSSELAQAIETAVHAAGLDCAMEESLTQAGVWHITVDDSGMQVVYQTLASLGIW